MCQGVRVHKSKGYVDDYRFWLDILELGTRWNMVTKMFQVDPALAQQDRETGKTRE